MSAKTARTKPSRGGLTSTPQALSTRKAKVATKTAAIQEITFFRHDNLRALHRKLVGAYGCETPEDLLRTWDETLDRGVRVYLPNIAAVATLMEQIDRALSLESDLRSLIERVMTDPRFTRD